MKAKTQNTKTKDHVFLMDGRIVRIKGTKEEIKNYIKEIKRKCKELKPLQKFNGSIN